MARDIGRMTRRTSPRAVKFFEDSGLADRQVKARCSGSAIDRMGDIVVQAGIDLGPFKNSPTVLWEHDASFPIARAVWIGLENGSLTSIAQFPPAGTDETSDRIYRLIKADVPLDVSIGFLPTRWEPIDPGDPWGGQRFLECELLEWSVCSVGAQRDSRIIGKTLRATTADTYDDRARRARQRLDRFEGREGREGLLPVHQYIPPPAPTPAEVAAESDRQRRAAGYMAAAAAIGWW
jgi:uncharacterized protein